MIPIAIHRAQCIALFDDGVTYPITEWYDGRGDDCPADDAVACVVALHDGWLVVDLRQYDPAVVQ